VRWRLATGLLPRVLTQPALTDLGAHTQLPSLARLQMEISQMAKQLQVVRRARLQKLFQDEAAQYVTSGRLQLHHQGSRLSRRTELCVSSVLVQVGTRAQRTRLGASKRFAVRDGGSCATAIRERFFEFSFLWWCLFGKPHTSSLAGQNCCSCFARTPTHLQLCKREQ